MTTTSAPRDWDGGTYDRIADPQARWGAAVLDRLELAGDERVLDAGCGSGRVTELLLRRLPRGSVVGLDASPSMLAEAARRLEAHQTQLELIQADLTAAPLPVSGAVDAVLSTATFHWIPNHRALFGALGAVLRAGGQLVVQCGGEGNIATVVEAIRHVESGPANDPLTEAVRNAWPAGWMPWNFPSAAESDRVLAETGFVRSDVWLNAEPTPIDVGEPLERFLGTVVLGAHLDRLPSDVRDDFVKAVAARLPHPEIDYVRLNIVARRR